MYSTVILTLLVLSILWEEERLLKTLFTLGPKQNLRQLSAQYSTDTLAYLEEIFSTLRYTIRYDIQTSYIFGTRYEILLYSLLYIIYTGGKVPKIK